MLFPMNHTNFSTNLTPYIPPESFHSSHLKIDEEIAADLSAPLNPHNVATLFGSIEENDTIQKAYDNVSDTLYYYPDDENALFYLLDAIKESPEEIRENALDYLERLTELPEYQSPKTPFLLARVYFNLYQAEPNRLDYLVMAMKQIELHYQLEARGITEGYQALATKIYAKLSLIPETGANSDLLLDAQACYTLHLAHQGNHLLSPLTAIFSPQRTYLLAIESFL